MDYKKVFTDFEKRYGEKCSNAYFIGKPLTFFSRSGITAGAALSVGGCMALSKRNDDRIVLQFSDSLEFLSCNKTDFKENRDKELIRLLLEVEKYGVVVGGARLFMYYNTSLSHPFFASIFASLGGFCKNVTSVHEIVKHFGDYEKNMLCLTSRKDYITLFDGQRARYLPFPDSQVKIVLANIGEKVKIKKMPEDSVAKSGIDALCRGDWEKFGDSLDRETRYILEKNRLFGIKNLFEVAVKTNDCYGSGILEDGGIFSVVANSRVDAFMHNLGADYEKHFGARPDFYVTRTEDSGIEILNSYENQQG